MSIDTSVFAVIADPDDPICDLVWCLHPCQDGQKQDFLELGGFNLSDKCTGWGLLEHTNSHDFRRFRNTVDIIASPSKDCPSGLKLHRVMSSGTAMWLSDTAKWAIDGDVLSICYASFRDDDLADRGAQPSQKHRIAVDEPWPAALLSHRTLTRTGGRFLANLTKGLETEEAGLVHTEWASHVPQKQSEQDFVLDVNNLFLKSTAFATVFGASLALLTQPRGSLLYRRPGPWFWRLVPVYGVYECIAIGWIRDLSRTASRGINLRRFYLTKRTTQFISWTVRSRTPRLLTQIKLGHHTGDADRKRFA